MAVVLYTGDERLKLLTHLGVYASVRSPGVVRVGDPVRLH
jgi:hypothetical protein